MGKERKSSKVRSRVKRSSKVKRSRVKRSSKVKRSSRVKRSKRSSRKRRHLQKKQYGGETVVEIGKGDALGINFNTQGDTVCHVDAVDQGGIAKEKGVMVGDYLLSMGGEDVSNLPLGELNQKRTKMIKGLGFFNPRLPLIFGSDVNYREGCPDTGEDMMAATMEESNFGMMDDMTKYITENPWASLSDWAKDPDLGSKDTGGEKNRFGGPERITNPGLWRDLWGEVTGVTWEMENGGPDQDGTLSVTIAKAGKLGLKWGKGEDWQVVSEIIPGLLGHCEELEAGMRLKQVGDIDVSGMRKTEAGQILVEVGRPVTLTFV